MPTLESFCPPCKIILNDEAARAKLDLFQSGLEFLHDKGFKLTKEAEQEAIRVICTFDQDMNGILALLETSVEKVSE